MATKTKTTVTIAQIEDVLKRMSRRTFAETPRAERERMRNAIRQLWNQGNN